MPADNTIKKCREVSKKYLKVSRSILKSKIGTSLVVQWSILHTFNAGGTGSIPGHGTKIPHATQSSLFKGKERKAASEKCTLPSFRMSIPHDSQLHKGSSIGAAHNSQTSASHIFSLPSPLHPPPPPPPPPSDSLDQFLW